MAWRLVGALLAASVLAGCTNADWDHTMSYVGLSSPDDVPPPARPAPAPQVTTSAAPAPLMDRTGTAGVAAPAVNAEAVTWCKEVATTAKQDAADYGFDEATQLRRADVAYAQCLQYAQPR